MVTRDARNVAAGSGFESTSWPRIGQAAIVGAAELVGVAIVAEGTVSRALNGIGAMAWVIGAVLLVLGLRTDARAGVMFGLTTVAAVVLAIVVRPSDLVAAVAGFGIAGVVVGLVARSHPVGWALLVPGIYLPVHLIVAISRSLSSGGTTIRTEPPPTAPLVPLAMVLAAALAGFVVSRVRRRTV